jgi:hypothetical protein
MGTFTANPITVELDAPSEPFKRADILLHGVDHSKASFEGRLFVNNPEADEKTPTDDEHHYVGSFWVFGHGGCAGDEGHCEIPPIQRSFDLRPEHQLTPTSTRVIVTEELRRLTEPGQRFSLRIVPYVRPQDAQVLPTELVSDLLQAQRIDLVTYQ